MERGDGAWSERDMDLLAVCVCVRVSSESDESSPTATRERDLDRWRLSRGSGLLDRESSVDGLVCLSVEVDRAACPYLTVQ